MFRLTDRLDMIIAVDWAIKSQNMPTINCVTTPEKMSLHAGNLQCKKKKKTFHDS